MNRLTTLRLAKEDMKFSAAHFTLFSATERERLHGHNFQVSLELTLPVNDDGISIDYRIPKQLIRQLCKQWDEYTLLPNHSPYLSVERTANQYLAFFNEECLSFATSDTLLLPVDNVTLESLSALLLSQFLGSPELKAVPLKRVCIGVSCSPGQWGHSCWPSPPLCP